MVTTGMAATGATGVTGTIIMNGAKIAGGVMIMVIIVAGISAKRTSAVIVKAGTIAMTIAVAAKATDVVMATIINVTKSQ